MSNLSWKMLAVLGVAMATSVAALLVALLNTSAPREQSAKRHAVEQEDAFSCFSVHELPSGRETFGRCTLWFPNCDHEARRARRDTKAGQLVVGCTFRSWAFCTQYVQSADTAAPGFTQGYSCGTDEASCETMRSRLLRGSGVENDDLTGREGVRKVSDVGPCEKVARFEMKSDLRGTAHE